MIKDVVQALNSLRDAGVIESYAIGGAVGATFYLEPVATLDVDVFVELQPIPGRAILDPQPIFNALASLGFQMKGEYVMIGGWPVQILAPSSSLMEEAVAHAGVVDLEGESASVMSAEHLAAIALETGRAKDKARLLQFVEQAALDPGKFESIVERHNLTAAWNRFKHDFLLDTP